MERGERKRWRIHTPWYQQNKAFGKAQGDEQESTDPLGCRRETPRIVRPTYCYTSGSAHARSSKKLCVLNKWQTLSKSAEQTPHWAGKLAGPGRGPGLVRSLGGLATRPWRRRFPLFQVLRPPRTRNISCSRGRGCSLTQLPTSLGPPRPRVLRP